MKKHNYQQKSETIKDRYVLYEAAVQSVDVDVRYFSGFFARRRKRPARLLREDFCGTAAMACEWVKSNAQNHSIGVDIDGKALHLAQQRNRSHLGDAAKRMQLVRGDVRKIITPHVDLLLALNFSYWVFKDRATLGNYFRHAYRSLQRDGIFVVDVFGGLSTMVENVDKRRIAASTFNDGKKLASFDYLWETKKFNPINHHLTCLIHFHLHDGTKLNNAFRYDWRMWTLPELQELMYAAGFPQVEVHIEDLDDNIFRRRSYFANEDAWIGYVVGLK